MFFAFLSLIIIIVKKICTLWNKPKMINAPEGLSQLLEREDLIEKKIFLPKFSVNFQKK